MLRVVFLSFSDTHSVFGSILVSLSLLNQSVMSFVHSKNGQRLDLVLPPRSLLVLTQDARYVWTHCIPPRSTDLLETGERIQRATRLSLTLRRLRRVDEGPCQCKWPGVWCDSSQEGSKREGGTNRITSTRGDASVETVENGRKRKHESDD